MGLRKDFLIHKAKTVESFGFVRADISNINNNIEHLRSQLSSVESRISAIDSQILILHKAIEKNSSEISVQQNNGLTLYSKIENISKSITSATDALNDFKNHINNLISNNQRILKDISGNKNAIKRLFSASKQQSLENKRTNSELKKSKAEITKLRRILDQKIRIVNRRIAGKKTAKSRKLSPKLRVRKRVVQDKTIITVKTPSKTLVKAVTPTKKNMVGVIRQGKHPLI